MKKILLALGLVAAMTSFGYSYVEKEAVTWTQVGKENFVTCTFALQGGAAYVTAEVLTNGVSVGSAGMAGDINKILQPGNHAFTYTPQGWRRSVENLVTVRFSVTQQSRANAGDYLAVNLIDGTHEYFATVSDVPNGVADAKWKTTHLLMKRVSAPNVMAMTGKNPRFETLRTDNDSNNHSAEVWARPMPITGDYYLGVYEFTAGQWEALEKGVLTGTANPSTTGNKDKFKSSMSHYTTHQTDWAYHPCSDVSHTDCEKLMADLATKSGLAFVLPSEEQWEYACRAGSATVHYLVNGVELDLSTQAKGAVYTVNFPAQESYYGGKSGTAHPSYANDLPVGTRPANDWGFYDLYGNLREWTSSSETATTGSLRYIIKGDDMAMVNAFDTSGGRQSWPATEKGYRTGFRACMEVK